MACHILVAQTGLVNLQCSTGSLSRQSTWVQGNALQCCLHMQHHTGPGSSMTVFERSSRMALQGRLIGQA